MARPGFMTTVRHVAPEAYVGGKTMRVNERLFRGSAFGDAARDYDAVRLGYPIRLVDARLSSCANGGRNSLRARSFSCC